MSSLSITVDFARTDHFPLTCCWNNTVITFEPDFPSSSGRMRNLSLSSSDTSLSENNAPALFLHVWKRLGFENTAEQLSQRCRGCLLIKQHKEKLNGHNYYFTNPHLFVTVRIRIVTWFALWWLFCCNFCTFRFNFFIWIGIKYYLLER